MLIINNLSKSFGTFNVLNQLNWQIQPSSITGLIGSNGAGKSTLLRCIAAVYDVDQGEVLFEGQSLAADPDLRNQIVFVSDEPFYLNRFNLKEMKNLYKSFFPNFSEEKYQELLQLFRFDENKQIQNFSKGLKRQSGLILALAIQPKLLLMDESFDGLDPLMRLTLKRYLVKTVMDTGMSVVISSHNIRELEDICDHMALLENHSIAFTQSLADLQTNYHKVQLGYNHDIDEVMFKGIDYLNLTITGWIATMVFMGNQQQTMEIIASTEPVLTNPMPISMEEIFVVEMENQVNAKS